MRQPRPWAGAFAVVYKAIDANGTDPFAVRVFTTESPERRERYEQISAYLKNRKLKCLCDFEYRESSIRSAGDGKWYPLILMEWVQGDTLFTWARGRCIEGDSAALTAVAQRWVDVVKELGEANVAHGDLQHANVMVTTTGEVKLVDYDCMCVPALIGRRNLEVGVPPYQHPSRNATTLLSLDLDNFSALTIYVGLRALAANPGLWMKYVEGPGYDKLLFRPEDFQFPDRSSLYQDLMHSAEPEVCDLTQQLFGMIHVRVDEVPTLIHLANSYAKIEQLLRQQDWEAAVDALNRRGQFLDAPAHLKSLIYQAYEHVCRQHAWKTFPKLPEEISETNDRKLVDTWNESLFAGHEPAERQRTRMAEARRRVTILDRINYLAQQAEGKITLAGERGMGKTAGRLPRGYQYSLRPRVVLAQRRVEAVARLKKRLKTPVVEAAVVAAWQAVVEAKCQHLVDAAWRRRIELAKRRAPLLKKLADIPDDVPVDQRDQRILDAWQDRLLRKCREADRFRAEHETALTRKNVLRQLQAAVESHDESAMAELLAEPCLADYPLPADWVSVAEAVRDRTTRTQSLVAALRDQRRSSFYELFDARAIRQYSDQFTPFESLVLQWTRSEVLPLEKLGLQLMNRREGLTPVRMSADNYRVQWSWPEPRFSDQCLLTIGIDEPGPEDDPSDLALHHRMPIDRENWQSSGGSRVVRTEPDWAGAYVAVWAVIDLGFRAYYSPPLILGRLEERSRWHWKGLHVFSSRRRRPASAAENE